MQERREACKAHLDRTEKIERVIEGNGRKGLIERVAKLEVMIWIVIMLLLGNGGLLAFALTAIAGLKR